MAKVQFINDEYYHILNRGIDDRNIFLDVADYERFLEGLKEFNTSAPVTIRDIRLKRLNRGLTSGSSRGETSVLTFAEKLVEIICFCLIPNHFHLLLKQIREGGISEFMRKVDTGYAYFFNVKHERMGHLFQGPFRAVLMKDDAQFLHITRYIHLNVLDLYMPEWREGKISDWEKAKKYLENYQWSSYPIFVGKKTSDFCHPEIFGEIFKGPKDYENFLKEWAGRDSGGGQDLFLE